MMMMDVEWRGNETPPPRLSSQTTADMLIAFCCL
jgi:hypothetical protein